MLRGVERPNRWALVEALGHGCTAPRVRMHRPAGAESRAAAPVVSGQSGRWGRRWEERVATKAPVARAMLPMRRK